MQQLAHRNPWKTVFAIVVFLFLTTTLSTAGWFYRYFRLREVPPPSAQALRTTRPVTRIMADPQAVMALVTGACAAVSFPSSKRPFGIARPLLVGKSVRRSGAVSAFCSLPTSHVLR